jgi:hypothetical protein
VVVVEKMWVEEEVVVVVPGVFTPVSAEAAPAERTAPPIPSPAISAVVPITRHAFFISEVS